MNNMKTKQENFKQVYYEQMSKKYEIKKEEEIQGSSLLNFEKF